MEPLATCTRAFSHVGVLGTYVDRADGKGVATHLFRTTYEVARRKGYEKIFTSIQADNSVALAAYEDQGFRIVGTAKRHAKLHGRYIAEIIVERFL